MDTKIIGTISEIDATRFALIRGSIVGDEVARNVMQTTKTNSNKRTSHPLAEAKPADFVIVSFRLVINNQHVVDVFDCRHDVSIHGEDFGFWVERAYIEDA